MKNTRRVAIHMSLCAGITGVACIFYRAGLANLITSVAAGAAGVFLLQLSLRGLGIFVENRLNVKKWVKRVFSIVLAVITIMFSLCSLVYAVQDGMLFYNVRDPQSREYLQNKPGYSQIEFTASNGRTYHGMMYRAHSGKAPLVIYFGGNGEVSYRRLRGMEEAGRWEYYAGYHYLYIDYEGYGLNEGKTGQRSMYEGALAVYDYAVSLPDVDAARIVAMGFSMGTGSAVYLAANRPVAGLILAAPYANGTDLYNNMLPIFYGPLQWLVKHRLESEEFAPMVTCQTLVIASRSDEAVPFTSSERLAKLFNGSVDFVVLNGVSHNSIFGSVGVYESVQNFLEEVASE